MISVVFLVFFCTRTHFVLLVLLSPCISQVLHVTISMVSVLRISYLIDNVLCMYVLLERFQPYFHYNKVFIPKSCSLCTITLLDIGYVNYFVTSFMKLMKDVFNVCLCAP